MPFKNALKMSLKNTQKTCVHSVKALKSLKETRQKRPIHTGRALKRHNKRDPHKKLLNTLKKP